MARPGWKLTVLFLVLSTTTRATATTGGDVVLRVPQTHLQRIPPLTLGSARAKEPSVAAEEPYRLEDLPILSRALFEVRENYVDPSRLDPQGMILGALDAVAAAVGEVTVRADSASQVTVTAGSSTEVVDLSGAKIHDVRAHLVSAMQAIKRGVMLPDPRAVEYAAVNGMLSTLDPLSRFLEPALVAEMRKESRGESGRLGLVLATREGQLVVERVENGPAKRAGLEAGDIFAEIGDHSTANVEPAEAIEWLRGEPGSTVAIAWSRGSGALRRATLQRERISVEPLAATLLDGGVAWAKLSGFGRFARRDLQAALERLRARNGAELRGIVLDLRGNAGGLFDEAIEVADLFLSDGVIVAVRGGERDRIREDRRATAEPADVIGVPMVVLVDGRSASASEIVAGALRDDGRAIVVGSRTAGIGSIQLLFWVGESGAGGGALKLTIARFFRPDGTTIDGTGIVPDVALGPACVGGGGNLVVFAPPRAANATWARARALDPDDAEEPLAVRYVVDRNARDAARECEGAGHAAGLVEDYAVRFSRDLLLLTPSAERARLLEVGRAFVAKRRNEEESLLGAELARRGIDWSSTPPAGTPRAEVMVQTSPAGRLRAGDTVQWTVTVHNRGDGNLQRLRAWSVADGNPVLDRREFLFGTVKPGERIRRTVAVTIPESMASRRDAVLLRFGVEHGRAPHDVRASFEVVERVKPRFALRVHIEDAPPGSQKEPAAKRDERVLRVEVRNTGDGASGAATFAALKRLDGDIFITRGRSVIGAVAPGRDRSASLAFRVRKGGHDVKVRVRVAVVDEALAEGVSRDLELALADLRPGPAGAARDAVGAEWHEPPQIGLSPDPRAGAPVVDDEHVMLGGSARAARHGANVRDVRIDANGRKVLYRRAPEDEGAAAVDLASELALVPGDNEVTVTARGVDGLASYRTLHVYRRSPSEVEDLTP